VAVRLGLLARQHSSKPCARTPPIVHTAAGRAMHPRLFAATCRATNSPGCAEDDPNGSAEAAGRLPYQLLNRC
jgi:hypothetical protein